jgi:hypothetical protein
MEEVKNEFAGAWVQAYKFKRYNGSIIAALGPVFHITAI